MRTRYILLTLIVLMQIASAVTVWWSIDKTEEAQIAATNVWMTFNAVAWVFAFCIIAMLTTGLYRQLAIVVGIMWIGNVCDELFFDPCIPQWNDVLSLGIAYTLAVYYIALHHAKKK